MIVSHEHKFIFVKTRKTAGTSVEIALSALCGDDDIITPIGAADEQIRRRLGYKGPANFAVSDQHPLTARVDGGTRLAFYNHMSADHIRFAVGSGVWTTYFKFSIERNPYDKVISQYHFQSMKGRARGLRLDDWVARSQHKLSNWPIYATDQGPLVDKVIKYETLERDLAEIGSSIGAEILLPQARAKGGIRTDYRPPSQVLTDRAIRLIDKRCRREIDYFGYELV